MKQEGNGNLTEIEKKALIAFQSKILEMLPGTEVYLFGSKARGDADTDSDIDLLVLPPVKVDNSLEEDIFRAALQFELEYDVIFGIIVYQKQFWRSPLGRSMPLNNHIESEGVNLKELSVV